MIFVRYYGTEAWSICVSGPDLITIFRGGGKMKNRNVTIWLVVATVAAYSVPGACESYRLFNDHFLDVGNTWNYRAHITQISNTPVDLWGDISFSVTGTAIVNLVSTKVIETNGAWGYSKDYRVQNSNFILHSPLTSYCFGYS